MGWSHECRIQALFLAVDLCFQGTTGKPKAVVISHKSYVNNARVIAKSLRHDKNKVSVVCDSHPELQPQV